MDLLGILLLICLCAGGLVLAISYICFFMAFFVPKHMPPADDDYSIPKGKIYEPYRDEMVAWMKEVRAMPHEDMTVTSFDGLKLFGRFYEYAPGAPIELMFHGYRGLADRDLCGGVQRCFKLGHSALIVDQRACGRSEGQIITFGVNEKKDCFSWLAFMQQRFGPDVKILLTGISMGASTVLMAAGEELPANVVGVLADCGYSSAKEIIKKVIRQMHLPDGLLYPFVKLGARLYGNFDLEETPPVEAVKKCKIPVIFFHGDTDDFVPCEMSKRNYEACASRKKLVTVPGAGHGLSLLLDRDGYFSSMKSFFGPELSNTKDPLP